MIFSRAKKAYFLRFRTTNTFLHVEFAICPSLQHSHSYTFVFRAIMKARNLLVALLAGFFLLYFLTWFISPGSSGNTSGDVLKLNHRTALLMGEYHLGHFTLDYILRNLTTKERSLVDIDAVTGYTMEDMRGKIFEKHPNYWHNRMLVLEAGLNDMHDYALMIPFEDIFNDFKDIVERVNSTGGSVTLWPIIPWRKDAEKIAKWNEQLEMFCKENNVGFLKDTPTHEWTDGFHLRRASYKVWADRTLEAVRDFLYA